VSASQRNKLAAQLADKTELDPRQVPLARDHVNSMHAGDDRVLGAGAAGEHVDEVDAERALLDPELAGGRELRVCVHEQDPPAFGGEQHPEVGGRGGLAHATLLVRDRDDHPATSCLGC
jgi:hypothetical protein